MKKFIDAQHSQPDEWQADTSSLHDSDALIMHTQ